MWWSCGSGIIELDIPQEVIDSICHSGDNLPAVQNALEESAIKSQIDAIDKNVLVSELKEYGAWDEEELANHEKNKERILWLACWDLYDNPTAD